MLVLVLKHYFAKLRHLFFFLQNHRQIISKILQKSVFSFLFPTFLVVTFTFVSKHLGPEINWNSVICHRNQECLRKESPWPNPCPLLLNWNTPLTVLDRIPFS